MFLIIIKFCELLLPKLGGGGGGGGVYKVELCEHACNLYSQLLHCY